MLQLIYMKPRVLITGSSGFIGSVSANKLDKLGYDLILFDQLLPKTRHRTMKTHICIQGNILNARLVQSVMKKYQPNVILHLAALTSIADSHKLPNQYYKNNVDGGVVLVKAATSSGCRNIVFSSSAAVYENNVNPISENDTTKPQSVYGKTKKMFEEYLTQQKHGHINAMVLRYFNVSGAAKDEVPEKKSRAKSDIISRILSTHLKQRKKLIIYGNDYPTRDGTAVRDYVHVEDVAMANTESVKHLLEGGTPQCLNIGSGQGTTTLELIRTFEDRFGNLPKDFGKKRKNEMASVVANITKAEKILSWVPKTSDINAIIQSSHNWRTQIHDKMVEPTL